MRIYFIIFLTLFILNSANSEENKNFFDNDYENLMKCESDELFKVRNFISYDKNLNSSEKTIEDFQNKIIILYFWSSIYQSLDDELKDLNDLAGYLKEQKMNDVVILPIYTIFDKSFFLLDKNSDEFKSEITKNQNIIIEKYNEYNLKNLTINIDSDEYFDSLRGVGENFDNCDYDDDLKNLQSHRGNLPAIFIINKQGKQVGKFLESLTKTYNDPKWNSREMHDYIRKLSRGEQ